MKRILYFLSIVWLGFLAACQSDSPAMISLGLDDTYVVERMKSLTLHPEFSGERYEWKLSYESTAADSLVATTRDYTFVAYETGTYWLKLNICDATNPVEHLMQIVVYDEEVAYSPYITRVYEYRPAPGQFVNELPRYTEGDTEETMRQKAEDCLAYNAGTMVSLGGYGGYIVVGFDHTIVNRPGEYDFKVLGNAFYSTGKPTAALGGSSEPVDLTPLSGLTKLDSLFISAQGIESAGPSVTNLSALSSLTELRTLELWARNLTDISPLSALTGLQSAVIQAYNTYGPAELTDVSALDHVPSLTVESSGNVIVSR